MAKPPVHLLLWEAKRFQAPLTMGLADVINEGATTNHFNLLWLDESLTSDDALATTLTGAYSFDVETAFGRTSWDDQASYVAFVSRPLGGHK